MRQQHSLSYPWIVLGAIILSTLNYSYLAQAAASVNESLANENISFTLSLLLTYAIAAFLRARITRFPGKETIEHIILIVTICFALFIILVILIRPFYSRAPVLFSYIFTLVWLISDYYLFEHNSKQKLGFIPIGRAEEIASIDNISATSINDPNTNISNYDAVVADFYTPLPDKWDSFITECHIKHIPVYDFCYISETLTGKVSLKDKSNAHFDLKTISPEYLLIKRGFDIAIVLITFPISTFILLLAALTIKLESKGEVLFTQMRTGKDRKPFKIYKLRSMYVDSDSNDLTVDNDKRITKVGKFIRKTRIDELPQIWNVLINDMSLIGPRPEYVGSDNVFRKSIPYYDYRYLAKPGITGWAQVNIGHVNDEESTREKLETDIYYVKNISLWLDLHIILKTLKVVRSGHGSR